MRITGVQKSTRTHKIAHRRLHSFIPLFFLLHAVQFATAAPRNVTIDDQLGDHDTAAVPRYIPIANEWHNQDCLPCAIKPDALQLFENTVMQTTFRPERNSLHSVDFNFNGTAIYVYFTLYNWENHDAIVTLTECNFTLDGGEATFFRHVGSRSLPGVRLYQRLVYERTGLPHDMHHMNISISGIDHQAFLSFDYAMYTTETQLLALDDNSASSTSRTPSPTGTNTSQTNNSNYNNNKSSGTSIGAIVGGVIGGLVVLAGGALLFFFCRRNKQNQNTPKKVNLSPTTPRPFHVNSFSSHGRLSTLATPITMRESGFAFGETSNFPVSRPNTQDTVNQPSNRALMMREQSPSSNPTTPLMHHVDNSVSPPNTACYGGQGTVQRRLADANERMTKLNAELARYNSYSASRQRENIGATMELVDEVRRLREEIEALRSAHDAPPLYAY